MAAMYPPRTPRPQQDHTPLCTHTHSPADMAPLGSSRAVITLDPTYVPLATGAAAKSPAANNNARARSSTVTVSIAIMSVPRFISLSTLSIASIPTRNDRRVSPTKWPSRWRSGASVLAGTLIALIVYFNRSRAVGSAPIPPTHAHTFDRNEKDDHLHSRPPPTPPETYPCDG